jgi:type 1 fimbria pilin
MIVNLRATLAVAAALTALGAAASASNVAFGGDVTRTPPSLYSPTPLAEQRIELQTFAATAAEYFGAPSGSVTRFDGSQPPSAQSVAPAGAPTAWLALRG